MFWSCVQSRKFIENFSRLKTSSAPLMSSDKYKKNFAWRKVQPQANNEQENRQETMNRKGLLIWF